MERQVTDAVTSKDYKTLIQIFSPSSPTWRCLGQGEQNTLSAHFITESLTISTTSGFFPEAFANEEMVTVVIETALKHLPPVVRDGMDNKLREMLFQYLLEEEGDYRSAALILAGMRIHDGNDDDVNGSGGDGGNESSAGGANAHIAGGGGADATYESVYSKTAAERTDIYVKIAECFLSIEDYVEADTFVTKAGSSVESILGRGLLPHEQQSEVQKKKRRDHRALILRYKSAYARVADSNRRFLQAAIRYHELSKVNDNEEDEEDNTTTNEATGEKEEDIVIDDEDLLEMLGRSATCAILAPRGPQCQRILSLIYKDKRLSQLDTIPHFQTHSSILTKMYKNQIIRLQDNDYKHFESSLADYQKIFTGDGVTTIVERAFLEHNMVAVSHIYTCVYFHELAELLGFVHIGSSNGDKDVSTERAHKMAVKMIMDGSLAASIDEVDNLLVFEDCKTSSSSLSTSSELLQWDDSISTFCVELNRVTDLLRA